MTKQITLKKVDAFSIGKLGGIVNIIIAAVTGLVGAIVAIVSVVSNYNGVGTDILISLGVIIGAVVIYPLFMGALGWVYGSVVGWLFNVVVGVSGGIRLEIEEQK